MSDETITDEYLDRLQAICDAATEGPWYTVYTDDKDSMNAVYVGTVERKNEHDGEHGMDGSRCGEIVAATLIQQMPRVDHDTELWDENAEFIAESRTALPLLVAEIRRLKGMLAWKEAQQVPQEVRDFAKKFGDGFSFLEE